MTNEEAKRRMEICRDFLANNYSDMGEPNFTAFNMAIKALEQQPCDDCISREDAKSLFWDGTEGYDCRGFTRMEIGEMLDDLPSVRPYKEIVEDKRACEKCIHYVTRDSKGVVLCGCDSWECDFEEVKK